MTDDDRTPPELGEGRTNYDKLLKCPNCGGTHIHQETVETFRREEDAEHGEYVNIDDNGVSIGTGLDGNPSSRRGGLKIGFRCELCTPKDGDGELYELCIAQHKGEEMIYWELPHEKIRAEDFS